MQHGIVSFGLHLPRSLTLMITDTCNLRCLHCWPESGSNGGRGHVDKNEIMKMVRGFRKLGVEKVCLTGGEPFLHPYWFKVVASVCAEPGIKEVHLQTNATMLTRARVRKLASLRRHNFTLQVSLEGAREETHDKLRGPGSFQRAMKGLTLLAEQGLTRLTTVSLTETQDNFLEIPALLELLVPLGICQFTTGTLVQGGRAAKKNGKVPQPPTSSHYEKILRLFQTDSSFREHYLKIAKVSAIEWLRGKTVASTSGCEFFKNPYIKADGRLYPCVMFQVDKYACHDVYSRPFSETLQKILPTWAALQQLSMSRLGLLQTCKSCAGRAHCCGGCMGRAYMAHSALMAVEDRCHLRKVVYNWTNKAKRVSLGTM